MKSQAIQYLALDVHQSTTVGTVRNDRGGVELRATVATEAHSVIQLVRAAGPRVWVAFEEGTQSQWLHDLLEPHAEKVIVCNTRELPERGNKNDRIDADRLSELLRRDGLKAVYHGSRSVLPLQALVRNYTALVQDATRVMQRIKALYRARAIATPGQTVYGTRRRRYYVNQLRGAAVRLRAETLRRVGRADEAAAAGEGGDDRRSEATQRVADPALGADAGPGANSATAGHYANATSVSNQASAMALRRAGRGHSQYRGSEIRPWAVEEAGTAASDARAEPEPQSSP
jgi:hypothetical protein